MGWASGASLMENIIDRVRKVIPNEEYRKELYKVLIDEFENDDWDTQSDIDWRKDAAFDEAMRELHPDWYTVTITLDWPLPIDKPNTNGHIFKEDTIADVMDGFVKGNPLKPVFFGYSKTTMINLQDIACTVEEYDIPTKDSFGWVEVQVLSTPDGAKVAKAIEELGEEEFRKQFVIGATYIGKIDQETNVADISEILSFSIFRREDSEDENIVRNS